MHLTELEDIYYKLFDEETVNLKFSDYQSFNSFRTRLYSFKSKKDFENDIIMGGYNAPGINITLHYLDGTTAVIAVIKFKVKNTVSAEFVTFDEVTKTWVEVRPDE